MITDRTDSAILPKIFLAILLITATVAGLLGWNYFQTPSDSERGSPETSNVAMSSAEQRWQTFLSENFAGDGACVECHAEQFSAQQRSGHSRTATPMAESVLAQKLDGESYEDPRRGQSFSFLREEDQFFASTRDADREVKFPVSWLLGSGVHARTPVSIDPGSGLGVEFRWTWFANREDLSVTPDHERFDDYQPGTLDCFGRPLDKTQARACVACHMTAVPPEEVPAKAEHFLANVGCERCHGPRKNHVKLAHRGRAEESPPLFTYDDPAEYMDRCAQCHRDETNIPSDAAPHELARFQPYGLKRSRCYQHSAMTCSTCHDPHDRVSTDRQQYRRTCLSCHSTPQQSPCPVEPAGKCIQCHMPSVEWHSGIKFHDHQIRIP